METIPVLPAVSALPPPGTPAASPSSTTTPNPEIRAAFEGMMMAVLGTVTPVAQSRRPAVVELSTEKTQVRPPASGEVEPAQSDQEVAVESDLPTAESAPAALIAAAARPEMTVPAEVSQPVPSPKAVTNQSEGSEQARVTIETDLFATSSSTTASSSPAEGSGQKTEPVLQTSAGIAPPSVDGETSAPLTEHLRTVAVDGPVGAQSAESVSADRVEASPVAPPLDTDVAPRQTGEAKNTVSQVATPTASIPEQPAVSGPNNPALAASAAEPINRQTANPMQRPTAQTGATTATAAPVADNQTGSAEPVPQRPTAGENAIPISGPARFAQAVTTVGSPEGGATSPRPMESSSPNVTTSAPTSMGESGEQADVNRVQKQVQAQAAPDVRAVQSGPVDGARQGADPAQPAREAAVATVQNPDGLPERQIRPDALRAIHVDRPVPVQGESARSQSVSAQTDSVEQPARSVAQVLTDTTEIDKRMGATTRTPQVRQAAPVTSSPAQPVEAPREEVRQDGVKGDMLTDTTATAAPASTTATARVAVAEASRSVESAPVQQVREQVQLSINRGESEATIRLNPEDLGSVRIQIKMEQGQVQLKILAEQGETRALLQDSVSVLRQGLEKQGIVLGEVEVSTSNRDFSQRESDGSGQQGLSSSERESQRGNEGHSRENAYGQLMDGRQNGNRQQYGPQLGPEALEAGQFTPGVSQRAASSALAGVDMYA